MKDDNALNWQSQLLILIVSLLSLGLSLSTTQLRAESTETNNAENQPSYYISPQLQLGLHTKASLESPIIKLVSSGTAVEVIKTEHEFSKIKTETGSEGWIKSKFLSQDEPAFLQLNTMREALQDAQADMKECVNNESIMTTTPDVCPDNQDSSALLETEKKAYEATIAALKAELKAWEQLEKQDRQAQKDQAEKTNQLLKEKLAMIASVAIGQNIDASQFDLTTKGELPEIQPEKGQTFLQRIKKSYLLLIVVSGLSFLLGIFVMDLFNRRRHGGYRI